ncbi:unnamed protein product [Microthlaspi erraticum]|uniref:Uncharacterized protein n=1 Tax=Microthlaspi erraticum TaxID=1685480 RepID=A0A6D2K681_9BRAS|nr:unnamed protein product [Microthlaspi erraticum]
MKKWKRWVSRIKHCGGLPLAVKVLGGLLAAQYTLREWKRIYENIRSHIVGGTSFNDRNIISVYHVLYLSFEELPVYLKHCFLYLAHFPEDYSIDVGELSYYWAAEGISRPRYYDGATIREVADAYMEELVRRNMVIAERNFRTSIFETCHLHDMMREVCVLKAEEENFVQIVDASTITSTANSQSISRRLVLHSPDVSINLKRYIKNPKLRSFFLIEQFKRCHWLASGLGFGRLMRILDLSYVEFMGSKLSSNIGELIHLRYLSLYQAHVTHLPSSMKNLKSLLYLNLDVSEIMRPPTSVMMTSPPIHMSDFLKELRELRYLTLPCKIQDGTKLELGNLINLERLGNFSTQHSSVTDLQNMTRLRGLSIIFNSQECTLETLASSLSQLRHLENFNFR